MFIRSRETFGACPVCSKRVYSLKNTLYICTRYYHRKCLICKECGDPAALECLFEAGSNGAIRPLLCKKHSVTTRRKCTACCREIFTDFVEMDNGTWHPVCHDLEKIWNVRINLFPLDAIDKSTMSSDGDWQDRLKAVIDICSKFERTLTQRLFHFLTKLSSFGNYPVVSCISNDPGIERMLVQIDFIFHLINDIDPNYRFRTADEEESSTLLNEFMEQFLLIAKLPDSEMLTFNQIDDLRFSLTNAIKPIHTVCRQVVVCLLILDKSKHAKLSNFMAVLIQLSKPPHRKIENRLSSGTSVHSYNSSGNFDLKSSASSSHYPTLDKPTTSSLKPLTRKGSTSSQPRPTAITTSKSKASNAAASKRRSSMYYGDDATTKVDEQMTMDVGVTTPRSGMSDLRTSSSLSSLATFEGSRGGLAPVLFTAKESKEVNMVENFGVKKKGVVNRNQKDLLESGWYEEFDLTSSYF